MTFRYDCRPVSAPDGPAWEEQGGRGPLRLARLKKLSGKKLAETLSAEGLCRELRARFPGVSGEDGFLLEDAPSGKPYLVHSSLRVSLTHSGGYAAAAVADVPLGLDLQELRPISPGVLRRVYSPEERAWIDAGEQDARERAVRLWTMKEAYGKMTGKGIFGGDPFHASPEGGDIRREYPGCRFLFLPAPEGLLLTACLGEEGADSRDH